MINEEYGKFELVCDICQNEHEQQYDTWSQAVEGKRETGFRVKREGGGYIDICRDCQDWQKPSPSEQKWLVPRF